MLAEAAEAKDLDTGRHVRRIQAYSRALALQLGMKDSEAEEIGYSAILHDVGKLHVPDRILAKPGPLNPQERWRWNSTRWWARRSFRRGTFSRSRA
jgi:putative two-component system response regulator